MPKPTSAADPTAVRVVVVTMDSHLSSAMERASRALKRRMPGLSLHFQPVLPALAARRDHCDAMVCAMSAGEVMRLTRMGRFSMDGSQSGPMALLKRLKGQKSSSSHGGGTGAR
jgi:magnesium chelatase subunit H